MKHASTEDRETFCDCLDSDWALDPDISEALKDCTDILPHGYCHQLDLPAGSTYADAIAILPYAITNITNPHREALIQTSTERII